MNPYKSNGLETGPLHGREDFYRKLEKSLLKPHPDHISVIGSRFIGKSTCLANFPKHFAAQDSDYVVAIYWDLANSAISDDGSFWRELGNQFKAELKRVGHEAAALHDPDLPKEFIRLAIDEIRREGKRILLLMDGLDSALGGSDLSRNLWDLLRSMAGSPSFRIVTASRSKLLELCMSGDAQSSEFWNLFPRQEYLGPLDEEDWNALAQPFQEVGSPLDSSTLTSLKDWSGGHPCIASAALSELWENRTETPPSATAADRIFEGFCDEPPGWLEDLWRRIEKPSREILSHLSQNALPKSRVPKKNLQELSRQGFAAQKDDTVVATSELLKRYAKEDDGVESGLHLHFGEPPRYRRNIPELLQVRMEQVEGGDPVLRKWIEQALGDLILEPSNAVAKARSISDKAITLIFDQEFPEKDERTSAHKVPQEWISMWQNYPGIKVPNSVTASGCVPAESKQHERCQLLDIMTGKKKEQPPARYIKKSAAVLVQQISAIGNGAGGHPELKFFRTESAGAICLLMVELFACLASQLPDTSE
jgi:hypothetical protein